MPSVTPSELLVVLIGILVFAALAFELYKYIRAHPQALANLEAKVKSVESSVKTVASNDLSTLHAKLDGLANQLSMVHMAVQQPTQVVVTAASLPPTTAINAAPPAPPAAPPVDPRTIPGGTTEYDSKLYPQRGTGMAAWRAAGSPYNDINNYQLDNTGYPTGYMADGTPVPGGPFSNNPSNAVFNAALFGQASGWWYGFNTAVPETHDFAIKAGRYAGSYDEKGASGGVTVGLVDKNNGASYMMNGDTFTIPVDTTLMLTIAPATAVPAIGTVQLSRR